MKSFAVLLISLLMAGCAFKAPPPPACVDDGRGLYPINPTRMTPEQLQAGQQKNLKDTQTETFYVSP